MTVLGHVQRGGVPTPRDRILSTQFGAHAIDLVMRRHFGKMVCHKGGKVGETSLAAAARSTKKRKER